MSCCAPADLTLSPAIRLCSFDEQVIAYDVGSGDTHLLEGDAASLIKRLADEGMSCSSLRAFEASGLQIPLFRLIMNLEYLGIVRARECE
ncbi:hypothetical protein MIB92_14040 [Aestuariirhabdus sp. Z084]|uniref:hypothetical protein n=1 Tax=Aestuariirhabdus haliotis TaxID=2918751 RepID=UPI00201B439D|nr:hypothetical protein [Aestuariirhabdus haliotis]MCL6416777.1 hypothetical protein [Aestuariirhabdus haliotis]MCL6420758.1 hypothetical protein [Aestuariirhabdus haliotis]